MTNIKRKDLPIEWSSMSMIGMITAILFTVGWAVLLTSIQHHAVADFLLWVVTVAIVVLIVLVHPARYEKTSVPFRIKDHGTHLSVEYGEDVELYTKRMARRLKNIHEVDINHGYNIFGTHVGTWSNLPKSDLPK